VRRVAAFGLLILTAVLVQSTALARLTLFGVAPDLVLVVVICLALLQGPTTGSVAGFSAGFLRDLLLQSPKGLTGLSYLIAGYVVGSVRPYVESTSVFVPVFGVFAGSLGATALYEVLQAVLGQETGPIGHSIQLVLLLAVYNTLLVPFVYPLVRRLTQVEGEARVYRS